MPAKNIYHDAVVDALQADGWTITADPLYVAVGRRRIFVDLAADRRALAAERGGERIAVEIQSFASGSDVENLHMAVGQYVVYRAVLDKLEPGMVLFLAVPDEAYARVFTDLLGQIVVDGLGIKLLVYQLEDRGVLRWIG
jgi:hypothetical protein